MQYYIVVNYNDNNNNNNIFIIMISLAIMHNIYCYKNRAARPRIFVQFKVELVYILSNRVYVTSGN